MSLTSHKTMPMTLETRAFALFVSRLHFSQIRCYLKPSEANNTNCSCCKIRFTKLWKILEFDEFES